MSYRVYTVSEASGRVGRAFSQLPWEMFRYEEQWTPDTRSYERALLRGDDCQAFLAVRDGRAIARAILRRCDRVAEVLWPLAIDDEEAWEILTEAIRERAGEAGRVDLAPATAVDGGGLLVEGFSEGGVVPVSPWQPEWIVRRAEAAGWLAGEASSVFHMDLDAAAAALTDLAGRGEREVESGGLNLTPVASVKAAALATVPTAGSAPDRRCRPSLRAVTTRVQQTVDARISRLVAESAGAPGGARGAVFATPDLAGALRRSDGYLGLRTRIDMWRSRRAADTIALTPAFPRGEQIVAAAAVAIVLERARSFGYRRAVVGPVPAGMDEITDLLETLGARVMHVRREYRVDAD